MGSCGHVLVRDARFPSAIDPSLVLNIRQHPESFWGKDEV